MKIKNKIIVGFTIMILLSLMISIISIIQINKLKSETDNLVDVAHLSALSERMVYQGDYMVHMLHHYIEDTDTGINGSTRIIFNNLSLSLSSELVQLESAFPEFKNNIDNTRINLNRIIDLSSSKTNGIFDIIDYTNNISALIHSTYGNVLSEINELIVNETDSNVRFALDAKYHFERMVHMMHHYLEDTATGTEGDTRIIFSIESSNFSANIDLLEANSSQDYSSFRYYVKSIFIPLLLSKNIGMFDKLDQMRDSSKTIHHIFPIFIDNLKEISEKSIAKAESDTNKRVDTAILFINIIIIASIVVGISVSILITKTILDPINNLVESAEIIANTNNLTVKMYNEEKIRDDEIGILEKSFGQMVINTSEIISNIQETSNILKHTSDDLLSGSEEINASAEEVASTSQAMSDGATSQTELISKVNQNLEELQIIVEEIIKRIQLNTQEVSQISLQTNILALNAGIEASRAGDYGRGFAVVAENVRKLSDQSKLASERIDSVANEIRDTLQASIHDLLASMLNIVSVSEETAASAEEVAAAAEEMTATIEELTSSAQELTSNVEKSNNLISKFIVK